MNVSIEPSILTISVESCGVFNVYKPNCSTKLDYPSTQKSLFRLPQARTHIWLKNFKHIPLLMSILVDPSRIFDV